MSIIFASGDIQQHLQTMFTLLRPEDNIKLVCSSRYTRSCSSVKSILISLMSTTTRVSADQAVRLESVHTHITRYMVVVSTNGRQDTEESVVLGMDFSPIDRWVKHFGA